MPRGVRRARTLPFGHGRQPQEVVELLTDKVLVRRRQHIVTDTAGSKGLIFRQGAPLICDTSRGASSILTACEETRLHNQTNKPGALRTPGTTQDAQACCTGAPGLR